RRRAERPRGTSDLQGGRGRAGVRLPPDRRSAGPFLSVLIALSAALAAPVDETGSGVSTAAASGGRECFFARSVTDYRDAPDAEKSPTARRGARARAIRCLGR